MKTLKNIGHLEGARVLLRVDFNVPVRNGMVSDDLRIRASLPTIEYLKSAGAKIILISHLESSDGGNPSLEPVANYLNKKLNLPVAFLKDYKKVNEFIDHELKDGDCVLLENLRFFDGEKDNDKKFARELASLADIFVNDAFSVSHREHASIVGVPRFLPSYAGIQFEKEVVNLSKAFNPTHPFLFILGGAKFETKLPLLDKFMGIADSIFIGGALANDFFKEKGFEIGTSKVSDASKSDFHLAKYSNNPKLILPVDILNQDNKAKPAGQLLETDKIMDAGPETIRLLRDKIAAARFILWNGPLGLYEDGYKGPTLELARMIAEATREVQSGKCKVESDKTQNADDVGVQSIVGGGDTLAAIAELDIEDKFTFVSTGGGAMLEFLAKGTLVGIEAMEKEAGS